MQIKHQIADLSDLILERKKRSKKIVWVTKDKQIIPIQDLSDTHLDNIISMLLNKMREDMEEEIIDMEYLRGLTISDIS